MAFPEHVSRDQDHRAHETMSGRLSSAAQAALLRRAWAWGGAAMLTLMLVYVATLLLVDSLAFAAETFLRLWYWMVPLVLGFGAQVGPFGYVRGAGGADHQAHGAGVAASGGASAASMVACCAHHLAEVLPLLGLAGVSLFLTGYQYLFLLAGILSNAVGIAYMLSIMGRHNLYASTGGTVPRLLQRLPRRATHAVTAAAIAVFVLVAALEFLT